MNQTRQERHIFWEWQRRIQDEGIRFFRHKENGKVLESIEMSWNGGTGMVRAKELFDERRYPEHRWKVCYTKLEPLNAMEVIAICLDSEA